VRAHSRTNRKARTFHHLPGARHAVRAQDEEGRLIGPVSQPGGLGRRLGMSASAVGLGNSPAGPRPQPPAAPLAAREQGWAIARSRLQCCMCHMTAAPKNIVVDHNYSLRYCGSKARLASLSKSARAGKAPYNRPPKATAALLNEKEHVFTQACVQGGSALSFLQSVLSRSAMPCCAHSIRTSDRSVAQESGGQTSPRHTEQKVPQSRD
jgi:hypothetical protein